MSPRRLAKRLLLRASDVFRRHGASPTEMRRLSPVFVIGANRSGTSLLSWLLSNQPDLEGIFAGAVRPGQTTGGHADAYAESLHVWWWLSPDTSARERHGDLGYWGLPQYLAAAYRRGASGDRERFELAWALERHRRSRREPLVKDVFNTLRIGMICDVFPSARFVLITRAWSDYGPRLLDKVKDLQPKGAVHPRAGLHWYLVNLIARYDLETFARGRYAEISLEDLAAGGQRATAALGRVQQALGLDRTALPVSEARPITARNTWSPVFPSVADLIDSERDFLASLRR